VSRQVGETRLEFQKFDCVLKHGPYISQVHHQIVDLAALQQIEMWMAKIRKAMGMWRVGNDGGC